VSLHPPLVKVVAHLDAPWKIITDKHCYKCLLVRQGTPISRHLVSMINDLDDDRRQVDLLRQWFGPDGPCLPVPRPREELTGFAALELNKKSAGKSGGIRPNAPYSVRPHPSPQEN
jgi:hypothetical protein